jgi:hypothetical protein
MAMHTPQWSFGPTFEIICQPAFALSELKLPSGWELLHVPRPGASDPLAPNAVVKQIAPDLKVGLLHFRREERASSTLCMYPQHCRKIASSYPLAFNDRSSLWQLQDLSMFVRPLMRSIVELESSSAFVMTQEDWPWSDALRPGCVTIPRLLAEHLGLDAEPDGDWSIIRLSDWLSASA